MLPQMVLSTENNYHTNIISLIMLLVAPISGLTVKISRFLGSNHSLYPSTFIQQKLFSNRTLLWYPTKHTYPCSCICLFSLFLQTKYIAVRSFSWHYFPPSSLLCIILFSVSILIWTLTESLPVQIFQIFLQIFNKKYLNLTFLQQFFITCYLFWRNGTNVSDTQYLHSNIQFGNDVNIYPVYLSGGGGGGGGELSKLARKDHCFRPYFLSISCKLIWELTYGHWVYTPDVPKMKYG